MKLVPEPIRKARYESSILFPDSEKRKQDYLPPKGEKKKKLTKKGKHVMYKNIDLLIYHFQ